MKELLRKALLIGSLLMSSNVSMHAAAEFDSLVSRMAPTLPAREDECVLPSFRKAAPSQPTSKYLAQRLFNMKIVNKAAGNNPVLTLDNIHTTTDGAYILLRQSDLKSIDSIHALQAVLQKPAGVHVILDVEADSNGVLSLYSLVNTSTNTNELTLKHVLPWIQHLHLINSARDVTTIGQSFLYGDRYITGITFKGFENVHTIESGFMLACPKLQTADLSSFEHLTTIKDCFMSETKSLIEVKLPTTRVFKADLKACGKHFLRGTSSLAHIQEEALESVTSIGSYFRHPLL